ncbi:glycosyltransferase [Salipiger mucosus]|uniref:Glycosyltransferase n=1 Tax=Salipiger mucosus DSM 16094 TaxID=1123237 RepID=S9QL70_9RHOB|nr:glycosyltransferase [Salipiger mucosus]EPX80517.1 glycosyltransferase [Salipiger mucosus DSM 16094]
MTRILHLVDDTNPGGVTRYLDFLRRDPGMAALASHEVRAVPRNRPCVAGIEADVIVSHLAVTWRGLPGLMALRARHAGTPLIHVEHSYSEGFAAHNVRARRRFRTLLRTAYALFDRIVAVSHPQGDWLLGRGLVPAAQLSVIPPCVDLSAFAALPAPQGPVRVIGALGRFDRQKGFDLLIRAFRALPQADLRLEMIGDGPERAALEALAQGDPRIRFAGFADSPAQAMAACDALAMPSRWEPYGLVGAEARAAGRPVLVSGVDGLRDQVEDGAIAVRESTVDAWQEALATLTGPSLPPAARRAEEPATLTRLGWAALLDGFDGLTDDAGSVTTEVSAVAA